MKTIWFALILIPAALALSACSDDPYDASKECGKEGNCCWSDNTCNPGTGLVCNTATKKCVKAKDSGTPPADTKPPADTAADTMGDASSDATSDTTPTPDTKPSADTKPTLDTAPTVDTSAGG